MASKNLPIVDWIEIEASAPGKFIISGEYSVVYEKQAIATAIDLRTKVVIRPNMDGKVRLNLKNLQVLREWPTSSLTTCRLVTKFSECLEYNDSMPVKLNHLLHSKYCLQDAPPPPIQTPINGQQEGGEIATATMTTAVATTTSTSATTTTTTSPQKQENNSSTSITKSPPNNSNNKDADKKADDAALAFLLLYIGLGDSYSSSARPPIDVVVESSVPVGSGLGSSSAYSVALCGALMRVFRVAAEKYIISNWAFNIDKFFHGKPSGVDNNIVSNGGYILFQNGKIRANELVHKNPIKAMLIDTGVSRSTRALSENVAAQLRASPVKTNGIFNEINESTTPIWRKITQPDFKPRSIADFLQANQTCLNNLGVGHEKLFDIFYRASNLDLIAKQTGAGGGGTAFVLYDASDNCNSIKRLRDELIEAGYHVHDHEVGCEGLVVKIVPDPDKRFPCRDR